MHVEDDTKLNFTEQFKLSRSLCKCSLYFKYTFLRSRNVLWEKVALVQRSLITT